MKYEYRIYQAPRKCDYTFMPFRHAVANGLDRGDYVSVWFDEIEAPDINYALEYIFMRHNRPDRPNGKGMRSLSVSDVVTINEVAYYCDRIGFNEIPRKNWWR